MKTIENKWRRILVASILPLYLLASFVMCIICPNIGIMMVMWMLSAILFYVIYSWLNPNN